MHQEIFIWYVNLMSEEPKQVEIIGDNFDCSINLGHMSKDNQRKSLHWHIYDRDRGYPILLNHYDSRISKRKARNESLSSSCLSLVIFHSLLLPFCRFAMSPRCKWVVRNPWQRAVRPTSLTRISPVGQNQNICIAKIQHKDIAIHTNNI
jgi:hypothetical protein